MAIFETDYLSPSACARYALIAAAMLYVGFTDDALIRRRCEPADGGRSTAVQRAAPEGHASPLLASPPTIDPWTSELPALACAATTGGMIAGVGALGFLLLRRTHDDDDALGHDTLR